MRLEQVVAMVLKIDESKVTDEISPQTCENWTSLKHLLLIKEISTNYNVKLDFSEIKKIKNVGDFRSILKSKGVRNE